MAAWVLKRCFKHGIFTEHIDHAMGKPWLGMDGGHLKYAMFGRTQGARLEILERFAEDLWLGMSDAKHSGATLSILTAGIVEEFPVYRCCFCWSIGILDFHVASLRNKTPALVTSH